MIDSLSTGRFEVRNNEGTIEYYIDGEQVQYSDLEPTAPERITFEVLKEMYDKESMDMGLRWQDE